MNLKIKKMPYNIITTYSSISRRRRVTCVSIISVMLQELQRKAVFSAIQICFRSKPINSQLSFFGPFHTRSLVVVPCTCTGRSVGNPGGGGCARVDVHAARDSMFVHCLSVGDVS
jgi:hypothetical protein